MALFDNLVGEMSFLEHLEELRRRIIKSLVAVAVAMFASFFFSEQILTFLIQPTLPLRSQLELQYLKPAGMFMVRINIALACGIALAMPVILFQLWSFISPGLLEQEKKYVPWVIFFATALFLAGAAFTYFAIVPVMLSFFISMGIKGVTARWDIGEYIGLVTKLALMIGGVFEMPLLIAFLTWIRLVTPNFLKRTWRYAIALIFILAAVITPTGDVGTQVLVAIPMVVLYVVSILVSMFVARTRGSKPEEAPLPEAPAVQPEPPALDQTAYPYTGPEYFEGGYPPMQSPEQEVESTDTGEDVPAETRPHRINPDEPAPQDTPASAPDDKRSTDADEQRPAQQDLFPNSPSDQSDEQGHDDAQTPPPDPPKEPAG
ncbi:MAG: twin-arginine translocase subunit TatC [Candidatus Latescibacteria bacterium]|nr:twin-arginine translocase subunit TatC [Candidatus Latescibacterota bacterium]